MLLQYPGASGEVRDLRPAIERRASQPARSPSVAADLLALTLLTPPGELGADIAVGTTQRFGVPMGYGGPHAGYICVRDALKRQLPAAGRRLGRRRRPSRLPARAAGPRAAHPPGEGDQQHLHRPGAAGGHGRHVRGLPRPRRPGRDRPAGAPQGGRVRRGHEGPRLRNALPGVLRHRQRDHARAGQGGGCPRGRGRLQLWTGRARTWCRSPATRPRPTSSCRRWPARWPASRCRCPLARLRLRRPRPCRRDWSGRPVPGSTRFSTATATRPRCCGTCAGSPTGTSPWTGR